MTTLFDPSIYEQMPGAAKPPIETRAAEIMLPSVVENPASEPQS